MAAFRLIGTFQSMHTSRSDAEDFHSPIERKTFKVTDLPWPHQIVRWNYGERCDCVEDRLKVYLDARNIVTKIRFG